MAGLKDVILKMLQGEYNLRCGLKLWDVVEWRSYTGIWVRESTMQLLLDFYRNLVQLVLIVSEYLNNLTFQYFLCNY